ncbi:MAG: DUF4861 family protein [Maribacter sp.]
MGKPILLVLFCTALFFFACKDKADRNKQILVRNTMDMNRSNETVSVDIASLGPIYSEGGIILSDAKTQKEIVSQEIDADGDGNIDAVLFQPEVKANSEITIDVILREKGSTSDSIPACYSRFVPERTDDYAWENNRVAFRTYGPTAQKMIEDGVKGGTLSSGIDAWLKRVEYPIINKWYKKETSGAGSYHEDNGEGFDNFHVGKSRGIGGIAKKIDTTYYFSKNFTSWETLYNGPIRTSFILTYADWDTAGNPISEEKHISLDYGSNLSKFEVKLKGTDTISAGLTLHEKDGKIGVNLKNGWISYWEPHGDSELGTAIIVPENNLIGYEHYLTDRKDESNLYAHLKTNGSKVTYYAGFGWKKSDQFSTKDEWEAYVDKFAQCLETPLMVEVK